METVPNHSQQIAHFFSPISSFLKDRKEWTLGSDIVHVKSIHNT